VVLLNRVLIQIIQEYGDISLQHQELSQLLIHLFNGLIIWLLVVVVGEEEHQHHLQEEVVVPEDL
jgi:hypothetical protein